MSCICDDPLPDVNRLPVHTQHTCLEEFKLQTHAAIKAARQAFKDDFKIVGAASSLFSQLADVSQFPTRIHTDNGGLR